MKPVSPVIPNENFEEIVFAKDQPEYIQLPAVITDNGTRVITRWRLSWRERLKILLTGDIWLSLLTFGKPLQPIHLTVDCYTFEIQSYPHEQKGGGAECRPTT